VTDERPQYIIASFAALAFLNDETGATRVQQVMDAARQGAAAAYLPVINLGEVLYITEREQGLASAQQVFAAVEELPVEILQATQDRVLAAAHVKANYPVSYADAFAIAAAQEFQAIILTGDPEFAAVEALVQVEWLDRQP
jgi:ribonuclease VapC